METNAPRASTATTEALSRGKRGSAARKNKCEHPVGYSVGNEPLRCARCGHKMVTLDPSGGSRMEVLA